MASVKGLAAAVKAAEDYAIQGPYEWQTRTRSRFATGLRFLLGASATLLLHGMFGLPLLWGTPQQGTNAWLSKAAVQYAPQDMQPESSMLMFIDSGISDRSDPASMAVPPMFDVDISGIVSDNLVRIEVGPPGEVQEASTAGSDQNEGMMALLFERYLAQVKARIERAWMLSGADRPALSCTIQIRQDRSFRAQEITMQDCGSDGNEHVRVARAVQRASPLPPPPQKELFSTALTITLFLDAKGAPEPDAASATEM